MTWRIRSILQRSFSWALPRYRLLVGDGAADAGTLDNPTSAVMTGHGARKIHNLQEKYGGKYIRYNMRGEENHYYSPKDKKMMPIGTSILLWTF